MKTPVNAIAEGIAAGINLQAAKALLAFNETEVQQLTYSIRLETGACMGMFLRDGDLSTLPTDPVKRHAIAVLNTELRKENPDWAFEEQVEFA